MAEERKRVPRVPPIHTAGVYLVYEPFQISNTAVYKCTAIRGFEELQLRNIDVFKTYYKPKGLSETIYQEDANMGASIVVLEGADLTELYIPSTYIKSYPGGDGLAYVNKIIVMDLGLMMADVPTSHIEVLLKDIVKQHVGVETEVKTVSVPYIGSVSHETGVEMERIRIAAIRANKTIYQQLQETTALLEATRRQNEELLQLLQAQSGG